MITRYELNSKTEQPDFNYLVHINGRFQYWLFNEFDDAVTKAKSLSIQNPYLIILILEPHFNTQTREWHAIASFKVIDNKIYHEKHALPGLHMKFHTDAGTWMNKIEFENNQERI